MVSVAGDYTNFGSYKEDRKRRISRNDSLRHEYRNINQKLRRCAQKTCTDIFATEKRPIAIEKDVPSSCQYAD